MTQYLESLPEAEDVNEIREHLEELEKNIKHH